MHEKQDGIELFREFLNQAKTPEERNQLKGNLYRLICSSGVKSFKEAIELYNVQKDKESKNGR